MQEQRPSIGSLLILSVAGFVGLGVVGFVLLLLLSLIGAWTVLVPFILVGLIFGGLWWRRKQTARDGATARRE